MKILYALFACLTFINISHAGIAIQHCPSPSKVSTMAITLTRLNNDNTLVGGVIVDKTGVAWMTRFTFDKHTLSEEFSISEIREKIKKTILDSNIPTISDHANWREFNCNYRGDGVIGEAIFEEELGHDA